MWWLTEKALDQVNLNLSPGSFIFSSDTTKPHNFSKLYFFLICIIGIKVLFLKF